MKRIVPIIGIILCLNLCNLSAQGAGEKLAVNAIQMLDSNNGWAVGNDGLIMRWNGSVWEKVTLPFFTESNLYTLHFTSLTNGYVGGEGGILLYYNGVNWQPLPIVTSDILSVFCTDANTVWIASEGFVYYMNNFITDDGYLLEAAPDTITELYFTDSDHGWAAGKNGVMYSYNSGSWSGENSNTSQHLNSLFFVNNNLGWAVGNNGMIQKYNSGIWSSETTSTNLNFNSIYMGPDTTGWAAGDSGIMYYYNGTSWNPVITGYHDAINGMSFLSSNNGWAVGENGSEYRYSGSSWTFSSQLPADPDSIPVYNQVVKIAGVIRNYVNWHADTLKVLSNLLVPREASKITVSAGTAIDFKKGSYLTIHTPLLCEGNTTDSIIFLNSSNISKSYSIEIYNQDQDSTIFSFCRISNSWGVRIYGGNFFADNTIIRDSCNIYSNGLLEGNFKTCKISKVNSMQISNCTRLRFIDCGIQDGINAGLIFQYCNLVTINNSIISNNMGSGIYSTNSSLIVSKCKMHNNQGTKGAAIWANASKVTIDNSLLTNNEAKSILPASRIGGGAIYSEDGKLNIANSTIAYNKCDSLGGGIYSNYSDGTIYNTILWGNVAKNDTNQFHYKSTNSSLSFINSDIHFDSVDFSKGPTALYTGQYLNNISVIPQFNNTNNVAGKGFEGLTADWTLKSSSPCINKGNNQTGNIPVPKTDIANNNRIYNQIVDIGPYETHLISTTICGNINTNTTWQSDTIYVNCPLIVTQGAKLTIIPGTVVYFNNSTKIDINGSIQAIGRKDAPIFFTAKTSWTGIWLNNLNGLFDNNDSTLFKYCRFEKINNGTFYFYKFRKLAIENSVFNNCKIGTSNQVGIVSIWYCAMQYNNNYYYGCNGGPLFTYSSEVTINNNTFVNNASTFFIYIGLSDVTFQNNKIINNNSIYEIIRSSSCNLNMFNNLISNNSVKQKNAKGNIYFNGSSGIIANNTIVNNDSIAIYAESSTSKFINNIVRNNPVSMVVLSNLSDWFFSNNMVDDTSSISDVTIENPIEGNPSFVNALDSIGVSSGALAADWNLVSISPCVNTGTTLPGIDFPGYDLSENNRLVGNIDLGAYENQGKQLEFTTQPKGKILCESDSIFFTVSVNDTSYYQWQKDGVDIPGATGTDYIISSVSENDEGNYVCVASNAFGNTNSNPAFVKVRTVPEITEEPSNMLVHKNNPVLLQVKADGSKPLHFQWIKEGINLPDTTPKFYIDSFRLENEGKYLCNVSNNCGSVYTDSAIISLAPSICMVTVYTKDKNDQGHNLIVWDKESKINYARYKIYRESAVAGYYDNIGSVLSDNPGVFEDTTVNPKEQAYLYKITAVNSNGTETDVNSGQIHKTIHLLTTKGEQGGIQLDWDQYIGFPYSTYYIYRSSDGETFELAHAMASSTRTWTDDTVATDTLFYYVAVQKADSCHPSGKKMKAGGGIYGQSVSNMEDNRLRTTNINKAAIDDFGLSVYPNPFNDFTTINYHLKAASDVTLEVYNLIGEKVAAIVNDNQRAGYYKYQINAPKLGLTSGVYVLNFKTGNNTITKKLIRTNNKLLLLH